jgi:glucose dehydrogenase
MRVTRVGGLIWAVMMGTLVAHVGSAPQDTGRNPDWDWPTYNRDLAGTRYSPPTGINTTNVSKLTQAWSYRLRPEPGVAVPAIDKPASAFEIFQEVTPIVVKWGDVSAVGQSRSRARS